MVAFQHPKMNLDTASQMSQLTDEGHSRKHEQAANYFQTAPKSVATPRAVHAGEVKTFEARATLDQWSACKDTEVKTNEFGYKPCQYDLYTVLKTSIVKVINPARDCVVESEKLLDWYAKEPQDATEPKKSWSIYVTRNDYYYSYWLLVLQMIIFVTRKRSWKIYAGR